jgi:hypothetical protein
VVGPALEVALLLGSHAEQLGDHGDRHRHGEIADEVERLAAAQWREAFVDERARCAAPTRRSGAA